MYISRFKSWWIAWKDYAAPLCIAYLCYRGRTISSEWRACASSSSERWMPAQFRGDDKKKKSQLTRSRRWIAFARSMKYIVIEFFNARLFDRYISYKRDVIFAIEIIVAWRKCLTSDLKRSENEKRKTMPTVLYRSKIKWSALFKWCINGISDA